MSGGAFEQALAGSCRNRTCGHGEIHFPDIFKPVFDITMSKNCCYWLSFCRMLIAAEAVAVVDTADRPHFRSCA